MDFDEFVKSKNGKYIIGGAVLLLLFSGSGEDPAGVQPVGQQPVARQPAGQQPSPSPVYDPDYQAPPVTPGYDGQKEFDEVMKDQERLLERQRQRWHDVITEEERVRDPETGETTNIPYEDYNPGSGYEPARPEDYERPPDHSY